MKVKRFYYAGLLASPYFTITTHSFSTYPRWQELFEHFMGTCAKEFLLKSHLILEHIISNWLITYVLDFTGTTNQSADSLGCYNGKAHPAGIECLY
jgi:hypothetical protein